MANANLHQAKRNKNDEFYTQYADIEREMNAYIEYDPDVFRGKTILCPCDDPLWSNFTKYFAQNFTAFGIRKVICTSYAGGLHEESELEKAAEQYDAEMSKTHGKLFTLEEDLTRDGIASFEDFRWTYLEGDGDFRSEEVTALRDEADFIITNPPFSLFREFLAWIMEGEKKFAVISNKNAVTYKEIFPLIKENQIWSGSSKWGSMDFFTPENAYESKPAIWLSNIEHGRRHQPLTLMTMEENLRHSTHDLAAAHCYQHYDNYDAIEVKWVDAIPSDYEETMGVPISFLDKHCPEQFEVLGITDRQNSSGLRTKKYGPDDDSKYNDLNARSVIRIGNQYIAQYPRIIIKKLTN